MKKLIFTFAIALLSLSVNAQLKVVETIKPTIVGVVKPAGILISELSFVPFEDNSSNHYLLSFIPAEYAAISKFTYVEFDGNQETLDVLYKILNGAFEAENIKEYEKTIQLGKSTLLIQGMKMMGFKGVRFAVTTNGITRVCNGWNKSQLDKLFGK